jgi:hypothetical protein
MHGDVFEAWDRTELRYEIAQYVWWSGDTRACTTSLIP